MSNQRNAMPLIAPVAIGPAPLPIEIAATSAKNHQTGEDIVILQLVTPAGVTFGFITKQQAKAVGEALVSLGTGIVLAPANALA